VNNRHSAAAPALWRLFTRAPGTAAEVSLLRAAIGALLPLGPVFLLLNFHLARRGFAPARVLWPCAALYLVGAAAWHPTPRALLLWPALAGGLACLGLAWRRPGRMESHETD